MFFSNPIVSQDKALNVEDYDRWSRIIGTEISDNGNWMAHALRPNGGDDTLHIQSLSGDNEFEIPNANNAEFSENNSWVSYIIRPDSETRKKLGKSNKPIFNTAELLNLRTGEKKKVTRANTTSFSNDGNFWVVHRKKPAEDDSKHKGSDLIIYNLQNQSSTNIGNVSEFAFNKRSTSLAYLIDANENTGNGVYVFNLKSGSINPLQTDTVSYEGLVWDDAFIRKEEAQNRGTQLAVLKGIAHEDKMYKANSLVVISNVQSSPSVAMLHSDKNSGIPENMIISEDRTITWTDDAQTVIFGIRTQEEKVKMSKDTVANVDVWHWDDDRIQTVQMRRYGRDSRFTHVASFTLGNNKMTILTDMKMEDLDISDNNSYMIGRDENPYMSDINWGVSPADLYRVNIKTGERKIFAKEINRTMGYSPDGRYFLYQKVNNEKGDLLLYDLEKDVTTDLTKNSPVRFLDKDYIYPHENPTYGVTGWTKDGKGVVLNHKYDLWMITLDGSKVTNITKEQGEKNKIVFRYMDMEGNEYIDTKEQLHLTAFGELTKKDGFYSLKVGDNPKSLIFEDASFGRPLKAEDADRVLVTRQTFVNYPDYYSTNTAFKNLKKVTDANPQQSEYAWGSKKLISFENGRGQKVQGTLTLPANYEEGKKYPTIIYFYEKMSDRHHSYLGPRYDDRPHASTYASNGYAFFMPDVYFEEGKPGTSSLDGITSAAQALIDQGYSDPDNIGLQGHSWSGYQTSFILTQTDMFKTIVTGAPPTNLTSFYNNIYGSSGTNHHGIMEIGQVRMGRGITPWSAREAYNRENPMFHAPNINTPFLILHGTEDGAVDWSQGLEFYNAARRLGKEVIMLSYPGEGHHLSNQANQIDFQIRMKQFFDHHLMGADAPAWMINGVPQTKKLYRKAK